MSNEPMMVVVEVHADDSTLTEPQPFNAEALEVLDRHKEPSDAMQVRKAALDIRMEALQAEYEKLAEESKTAGTAFYKELFDAQPELKTIGCLHISDDHQTWQTHVVKPGKPTSGPERLLRAIFGEDAPEEDETPATQPKWH